MIKRNNLKINLLENYNIIILLVKYKFKSKKPKKTCRIEVMFKKIRLKLKILKNQKQSPQISNDYTKKQQLNF